jgi:hypothetical protein
MGLEILSGSGAKPRTAKEMAAELVERMNQARPLETR